MGFHMEYVRFAQIEAEDEANELRDELARTKQKLDETEHAYEELVQAYWSRNADADMLKHIAHYLPTIERSQTIVGEAGYNATAWSLGDVVTALQRWRDANAQAQAANRVGL